jgi:hypothetical protein
MRTFSRSLGFASLARTIVELVLIGGVEVWSERSEFCRAGIDPFEDRMNRTLLAVLPHYCQRRAGQRWPKSRTTTRSRRRPKTRRTLDTLQSAITTMFLAMEAGLASRADWNLRHTLEYKIAHFFSGFDGIFILNQDLLFERHYYDPDLALNRPKKWSGSRRPGIQVLPDPPQTTNDVEKTTWTPRSPPFTLEPSHQPYFKLHGSWNWRSADNQQMLIMGVNKIDAIRKHPLLIWYHDLFEAYLSEPGSRLMVMATASAIRTSTR